MTFRRILATVLVAAATAPLAPLTAQSTAYTTNAYCTNAAVPASWGDVSGAVDFVGYMVRTGFGAAGGLSSVLNGWGAGYSDLPCAMWGGLQANTSWVGEIAVASDGATNTIRFDEVTIGRWASGSYDVEVRLYNDDYSSLLFQGFLSDIDASSQTLLIDTTLNGTGRLQWDNPWRMGVGSLQVSVDPLMTSVPEPSTIALTALGLGGLALVGRRRRA